ARLRARARQGAARMELSASAVLVTWNSAAFLSRCVDALRAQTVPLELIHVDNASADDSVAVVHERFSGCTQMVNDTNRGFAAADRMSFIRDVSIGGEFLDEDFFAYREDADVAWRGRLLGWRALYVPDAVAQHVRRVTPEARRQLPERINRDSVRNRFLLRLKNEGLYLALRNAPFELARDLLTIGAV